MALSLQNLEALKRLQERRAEKAKIDPSGLPVMTPERLRVACLENEGFETPELNDKLYLHFQGFRRIENLEPYVNLKALWLESNGIQQIEGLSHLADLRSLFLQQNLISTIENLDCLSNLVTLDLSGNCIRHVSGLAMLPNLSSLNLAKNALDSVESIAHLKKCPALSTLNLSDNSLPADQDDNAVITLLGEIPKLATLYLKGNPLVSGTRFYRKTVLSIIGNLQYLDDRPVFEVERIAVQAWKEGGRDAEVAAKLAYETEQHNKSKESMQRFREWQEQVRARRSAALASHNEELRARGDEEVAELPRKSYVTYGQVSDRYVDEHLRMKALIEKAEKVAKTTGFHGTAMMDLPAENWQATEGYDVGAFVGGPGVAGCRADLRENYASAVPITVSDEAHERRVNNTPSPQCDAAAIGDAPQSGSPVRSPAHQISSAEVPSPLTATAPALPPSKAQPANFSSPAKAVSESLRLFNARGSPHASPSPSKGATSNWGAALDGALTKFAKQAAFDFEKVSKALKNAVHKGVIKLPDHVSAAEIATTIDAESCRIRYAELTIPSAETAASPEQSAPLTTFQHIVAAKYATAQYVDIPDFLVVPDDAVPPQQPVKPLERLVRGEFRLHSFRDYVPVPTSLPSMGEANPAEGTEKAGDDDEGEESIKPLSRQEILSTLTGFAGITVAAELLGDGSVVDGLDDTTSRSQRVALSSRLRVTEPTDVSELD